MPICKYVYQYGSSQRPDKDCLKSQAFADPAGSAQQSVQLPTRKDCMQGQVRDHMHCVPQDNDLECRHESRLYRRQSADPNVCRC